MYAILRYQPNGSSFFLRPKSKGPNKHKYKYPFPYMLIGDSFFVPKAVLPKGTNSLYTCARREGLKINLQMTTTGCHVNVVGYCMAPVWPSAKNSANMVKDNKRQAALTFLNTRLSNVA